jgi:hypothetical protein
MYHWHSKLDVVQARRHGLRVKFASVKMSGDFAQIHMVRKLIASGLIIFVCHNPPGMETKQMQGIYPGVCGTRVFLDRDNQCSPSAMDGGTVRGAGLQLL